MLIRDELPKLAIMADKISNMMPSNEVCEASTARIQLLKILLHDESVVALGFEHTAQVQQYQTLARYP
ncbi:hypothetical protein TNCV_1493131 [Trichonephila clavipes]|nr:hypothetical protein TNCV_1493131 [Trichonephila clavipes]